GASGAVAAHDVNSTVAATIAAGARLQTLDLDVLANNVTRKEWLSSDAYNAAAGSGGLANASASQSKSTIVNNTSAALGENATVYVIGDLENPGRTDLSAVNDIIAYDKAKLDAG